MRGRWGRRGGWWRGVGGGWGEQGDGVGWGRWVWMGGAGWCFVPYVVRISSELERIVDTVALEDR